jgi:hypothetical protein
VQEGNATEAGGEMPPVLLAHLLWRGDATVALPRNPRQNARQLSNNG